MTTPPEVSARRRDAVDISWARTPDRAERTEPARAASPQRIEYWVDHVRAEGIVTGEAQILAAAEKYHSVRMRQLARKAVAARAAKKNTRTRAA